MGETYRTMLTTILDLLGIAFAVAGIALAPLWLGLLIASILCLVASHLAGRRVRKDVNP